MALPPAIRRPLEFLGLVDAIPDGDAIGPIREGTPEDDGAAPSSGLLVRTNDPGFIPSAWLDAIADNEDARINGNGEGLKLYSELASDDTVFSTMQQRRLAITSKDWEVVPGDDADPRSVKAADDFRAMIDDVGFDRVTGMLHWAIWYGYGVGEGLYIIKDHDGRPIVWLDDIIVPDRRHFGFTNKGELRFVANASASITGDAVPANKFVAIRTGGTHDFAFYGLGLAHFCYWAIFFKRAALKFWALYLEKMGVPTVALGFSPEQKDDKDVMAKLLQAGIAIGQDRAVLFPEDMLTDEKVQLLESSRSTAPSYSDFVDEQNEAIMRVVLGQPGTSKGVSSGLNSDQASEHADVKAEIVKADSDLITDAIQRTFGKWLTRWNHGPDVKPPILRRILDDAEDLNVTADRDVKLSGIGINRTEDSIKATYGEGYEVDRLTSEQKAANDLALATAKTRAVMAQPANDNPAQAQRKRVSAAATQFGVEDEAPLYVSRKLLNAGDLIAWARKVGIGALVPASDMHVTIVYSETPVDWFKMGDGWYGGNEDGSLLVRPSGPRSVERFGPPGGNEGAIVLRFDSPELRYRNESMIERGASSSYPEYKAHVTISYQADANIDLSAIEPYVGELKFGPEIFEPIRKPDVEDGFLAFTAKDEEAIDRLITQLTADADPVFEAMAAEMRKSLQGVETVEAARVAILSAVERLPVQRLAYLTALPLLAERAGASIGADDLVTA